ncbi:MAG: hypothetical protein Q8Q59_12125 [Luteolibacter sp.]|jgi:hypothetical protein|nr:hypothetical protein [Luteolibacter sp.]
MMMTGAPLPHGADGIVPVEETSRLGADEINIAGAFDAQTGRFIHKAGSDAATLGHLVSSKRPDELFLSYRSEFDGLPEPLCALYAPAALPLLRDPEIHCPRKVLIRHECRLLDPVTPRTLDNANTPGDWQAANTP